jgi:4-amino-4-deoxy-L-arabinose transferase-like glycosyltransferase
MPRGQNTREQGILATIVLAYVVLGSLYAALTPRWQVPDEPAHYNYIRHLVEQRRFPVLQMGDYDQEYLHRITTKRFDPALSIDPIRYEFHQPPLYYVLAAPLYALTGGMLLPLRLLSVAFGAGLLVVAHRIVKTLYPDIAWPALGATAFIAFIPQHVAMTAAVNNDTLAELLLAIVLLRLARWLATEPPLPTGHLIQTGVWIGVALLTKAGVYITVPLAFVAVWLKFFRTKPQIAQTKGARRTKIHQAIRAAVALLLPALLLSLPWFARNVLTYGGLDILGLQKHDRVVVGQPRTTEWLAEHGGLGLATIFGRTTFRSFWATFGWMAVPIDARIYVALRLLTAIVLLGLFLRIVDRWGTRIRFTSPALLLVCSGLLTLATYLGYNLTFYQAQGRYLFPALVPLGLAWSIGLRESLHRSNAFLIGIALTLAAALGAFRWLTGVCDSKWQTAINGAGATFMIARRLLPEKAVEGFFATPYWFMAALCAVSPFWFIIPHLTP